MMFFGNLNYVAIALIGGLRVASGQFGAASRATERTDSTSCWPPPSE